jgi:hypothetical protein
MMYIKVNMFSAGKVENWILLFDLEHAQPWNMPFSLLKPFADVLSLQFRCHTAKVFVVNTTGAFVWTWDAIKVMLTEI